jgi:glycosyltransferase involved in cell wall biosynthesis
MAELLDKLHAKVKILRLTDDVASFRYMPDKIKILERYALEKADIVVVTSVVLKERLSYIRPDVVHIPNGVDYEFYQSADRSVPPEYKGLEEPIVVYVGAIDYWFDVDLVAFLARCYPAVNFVFIGIARISLGSLHKFRNVHLLGARPYSELPKYLWNATVGFIPFKKLPLVESVNPVKLWEYMACGLPVVSIRWEELVRLGSPAFLADTYSEFAERLSEALEAARDASFKERCMNFAADNTWDKRAMQILGLAETCLRGSKRAPSGD